MSPKAASSFASFSGSAAKQRPEGLETRLIFESEITSLLRTRAKLPYLEPRTPTQRSTLSSRTCNPRFVIAWTVLTSWARVSMAKCLLDTWILLKSLLKTWNKTHATTLAKETQGRQGNTPEEGGRHKNMATKTPPQGQQAHLVRPRCTAEDISPTIPLALFSCSLTAWAYSIESKDVYK